MTELDASIDSSKKKSLSGLDRIDYAIIRSLLPDLRLIFLNIFNELYVQGLFPDSWRLLVLTLVSKFDGKGIRPIALFPCLLKVFKRMVYRTETQFLLPDFQSGFRNSRSCTDNFTLTNRIHTVFLRKAVAVFLDIAGGGAFDNVIPNILIQAS